MSLEICLFNKKDKAMVDEELQNTEINLDDFNFDDLSDVHLDNDEVMSEASSDVAAEEFDLGDFSFDDLDFETSETEMSDDTGRKEPFFEMPEEVEETVTEAEIDVVDEAGQPLLDDEIEAGLGETIVEEAAEEVVAEPAVEEPEVENLVVEEPVIEETVSEDFSDAIVEDVFSQNLVDETEDDQSVQQDADDSSFYDDEAVELVDETNDTNFEVVSEAVVDEEEIEPAASEDFLSQENQYDEISDFASVENAEDVFVQDDIVTDSVQSDDEFEASEVAFVDDVPEESPLIDDVSFSDEEADAAHSETFGNDELVEQDLEVEEYTQSMNDYSAVAGIDESPNVGYVRWFSGQSDLKMFEISKGFDGGNFEADEECKTLHINVGYDTYGWEVQFSDGVVMNLRDVREYQLRNGRLPNADGRIIYGHSSLLFSGVERIVIYESVRYFSYGA